jgi:hypothetical protein
MADRELSTRDFAETAEPGNSEHESERGRAGDPAENADRLDQTTNESNGEGDHDLGASAPVETTKRALEADSSDAGGVTGDGREPLLPGDQSERFTTQWQEIQASFVDRPRESVEQADALVADLMQRLAASFSDERERLEEHWDRGDDVSTEDLRVALTRYRSFFDRLLTA